MREIKFRAWDKTSRKIINPKELINLEGETSKNLPVWLTLMQYTGLKDKNGKEIYEGDIVKIKNEEIITDIFWCEDCWTVFVDDECESLWVNQREGDCEVIGNIYENAELLDSEV